jgi:uncharacterized pyridoxamine 5'-phosphate oxidase family protein
MSGNLERVYSFLRDVGHTFVCTVEGDAPKSRPLNSVCVIDGRLGFMVGDKKDVYRQLVANPKVELVSMDRRTEWLRIEGEAHLAEDQSPADEFLARSGFLREKYAEMGMNLRLFLIDDGATVQRRTWEPLEEFPLYG